jgi:hypothetical protein
MPWVPNGTPTATGAGDRPGAVSLARGAWTAVIGMVALNLCELVAMRNADWHTATANAGLTRACYGISVTVIGLGTASWSESAADLPESG